MHTCSIAIGYPGAQQPPRRSPKCGRAIALAAAIGLLMCADGLTQTLSLQEQATQWLMQEAPPNPPLRGWLDGISMYIKDQRPNADATVSIESSVLPNGLVEVRAHVGQNLFVWQVDYVQRKAYPVGKYTADWMRLIGEQPPLLKK